MGNPRKPKPSTLGPENGRRRTAECGPRCRYCARALTTPERASLRLPDGKAIGSIVFRGGAWVALERQRTRGRVACLREECSKERRRAQLRLIERKRRAALTASGRTVRETPEERGVRDCSNCGRPTLNRFLCTRCFKRGE